MNLPRILVIGPMKSGSTTLCELLSRNPEISFSKTKEPHLLMRKDISDAEVIRGYHNLYRSSQSASVLGDGSTGYSKLPWCSPVPERARKILGEDIQIVFIKRNRMDRCVSHHRHVKRSDSKFPSSFEDAIEQDKTIVRFSFYAPVMECWLNCFDRKQIHLIDFNLMINDPEPAINPILRSLNIFEPENTEGVPPVFANRGSDQRMAPVWLKSLGGSFSRSRFYKEQIRHLIPDSLIRFVKHKTYRNPNVNTLPPVQDTLERLAPLFHDDEERLQNLMSGRCA